MVKGDGDGGTAASLPLFSSVGFTPLCLTLTGILTLYRCASCMAAYWIEADNRRAVDNSEWLTVEDPWPAGRLAG
ncbi:hypothetical protein E2C01_063355 [Portunus trituberculatus]|uniref:Uncharacterized protein n=1 Tax=Portunus trituberculatus TaxID=210409 RepID=A0A5B7HA88_PORTR|nr:hypothetical protein [Portunus trituberculatus]